MNIEIRGVHYDVKDEDKDYIDKKMHRIQFAQDDIIDLHFSVILEKKLFKLEVTVHFRWGHEVFIHVDDFVLYEGIDKLIDKLEARVSKEKERIKRH
jgi:putative sigma-54 modulation protein